MKSFLDKFPEAIPVDVGFFYECIDAGNKASRIPLRNKKPKAPGFHLSDTPINRAVMAIIGKCKAAHVSDEIQQSVVMRFMAIPALVEDENCKEFVRKCDEGNTELHHAILDAAAQARFVCSNEYMGFDITDVMRLVREYVANESEQEND